MGCNNNVESAGPNLCNSPIPQINQGTTLNPTKTLQFTLNDKSTGKPVDLSTATALVVNFPATNTAGFIQKTLGSGVTVVTPGQLGVFQVVLQSVDVALLVTSIISVTAYVTNATLTNEPCQFLNALQVNPPPFPGA